LALRARSDLWYRIGIAIIAGGDDVALRSSSVLTQGGRCGSRQRPFRRCAVQNHSGTGLRRPGRRSCAVEGDRSTISEVQFQPPPTLQARWLHLLTSILGRPRRSARFKRKGVGAQLREVSARR
jgi:hypothetical protein